MLHQMSNKRNNLNYKQSVNLPHIRYVNNVLFCEAITTAIVLRGQCTHHPPLSSYIYKQRKRCETPAIKLFDVAKIYYSPFGLQ